MLTFVELHSELGFARCSIQENLKTHKIVIIFTAAHLRYLMPF